MKIGLIDVDSHHFCNLALMKLSAWHKANGDEVEWWNGFLHYDRVYMSKVFTEEYTPDMEFCINADEVIRGGTGYGLDNKLPEEVEHMMPDYSLYGIENKAYGFLTRGCPRSCPFCIVSEKEGRKSVKVADLDEFWNGQKDIVLLDPNLLAYKDHESLLEQIADSGARVEINQGFDARLLTKENIEIINRIRLDYIHFAWDFMSQEESVLRGLRLWQKHTTQKPKGRFGGVYVLTNFDSTHEEDLFRVEKLKDMGFDPYVMIFNKKSAPKKTRMLQRYTNNRIIFRSMTWEEYEAKGGRV